MGVCYHTLALGFLFKEIDLSVYEAVEAANGRQIRAGDKFPLVPHSSEHRGEEKQG